MKFIKYNAIDIIIVIFNMIDVLFQLRPELGYGCCGWHQPFVFLSCPNTIFTTLVQVLSFYHLPLVSKIDCIFGIGAIQKC